MDISSIPVISVSYNSAELIDDLLRSLRAHYSNPVTIVDGSGEQHWRAIEAVCANYAHVRFIHFDYNIHHGPGMAWAFQNLDLHGPVLVLDSDICIIRAGFLEDMLSRLRPGQYGVGSVNHVNEGGYDVDYTAGAIAYLHPACMLVDADVVRQWPMPTKHGAPMIEPMLALHRAGRGDLIGPIDWVRADFTATGLTEERHYLRHDWQGTVKRSGSYNLDEWTSASRSAGEQRQIVLGMVPADAVNVLEIGANDGQLARACKETRPAVHYTAVGGHPDKSSVNKNASDALLGRDPDALDDLFFRDHAATDCWIFDQALERSAAPEQLLARLRKAIRPGASVIAVVPNGQHWGLQMRLAAGDLAYGETGLLSPSQRRWFSRATLFALFHHAGFQVVQGVPQIAHRLNNPPLEALMRQIAATMRVDPDLAFEDAQADCYIIRAVPR